ncbi:hypothetical protein [Kitasatospora sp. NPDC002965]|uniref:hypothetical protein n=1 Tax=Kitasatospora sp. NPDC002965 TaxID=3154775 RepID=UPI0033B21227
MTTVDDDFIQQMNAIQAARAAAIQPLAEIRSERNRLLLLLAATDEPYAKAYAAAEAAGWSAGELTTLGAEAPTRRATGRPRKVVVRKPAKKDTAPASAPAADADAS